MSEPKAALRASRETGFAIRHDDATTVVRVIADPAHPEYDPRVELPVDENLVESLIRLGQLQQAVGYKDGMEDGKDVVVLVDGRQRWKAMQEAWNRFREDGIDMKLAPSFRVVLRGQKNAAQRREIRISANRHRQELSGLALAQELRNHLDIVGESEEMLEEARVVFNFASLDALRNCLALLDTTPAVQEHLASGKLSPTGALQLSRQAPEVQDAVAGRIAAQTEGQDMEDDGEGEDDDAPDADAGATPETPRAPAEKPERTNPVPVREVKEMIRDATGKKSFEMVNLRLVEKRLEKVATDLDKAMTKLEDCRDGSKTQDLAARVAKLQGWDEALRWARGETTVTGAGAMTQGNDPMSAAWHALIDALVNASWPTVVMGKRAGYPTWEQARRAENGYEENFRSQQGAAKQREDDSHVLFVAGEHVAKRRIDPRGITTFIEIDTTSKWFARLMDPHGSATRIIRDWGAHGWIEAQGKTAGLPSYKRRWSQYKRDWVSIIIDPKKLEESIKDTPLGMPFPVSQQVLDIIIDAVGSDRVCPEARFGSPWAGGEGPDGVVGPDLGETDTERESILDEISSVFDLGWIRPEERVWSTISDLIAWVEREVSEVASAASAEDPKSDPAGIDQGDDDRKDGDA